MKGLCWFFILLTLLPAFLTAAFAAQDGHGGSTEVIALVEPDTVQPSDGTTQPFTAPAPTSDSYAPVGGEPVQTGGAALWIAPVALLLPAALFLIVWAKSGRENKK